MTEEIRSSETSVLATATRCHIAEDGILHRADISRAKEIYGLVILLLHHEEHIVLLNEILHCTV
jgi:hypothetical protein